MPQFQMPYGEPQARSAFWELPEFVQGYIEAMFFTSTGSADDGDLQNARFDEMDGDTLADIIATCERFQHENADTLSAAYDLTDDSGAAYDESRAGNDLWYTSNGHGTGYWDRELGDTGDALADSARKFRGRDLYRGDDGKLYLM